MYFYLKDVQQNAVLNHVSIATYCISTWKMYSKMQYWTMLALLLLIVLERCTLKMYSKMQYWTMLALLLIVFLLERCTAKCSTEPCYLKDVHQNAVLNHVSIATYCISTWKMYSKMQYWTMLALYLLYFYLKDVQQSMQYWTMLALLLIVFLLERCTAKCSKPCYVHCISTWKMYMQYWTMLALLLIVFLLERCTAKCSTEPC